MLLIIPHQDENQNIISQTKHKSCTKQKQTIVTHNQQRK